MDRAYAAIYRDLYARHWWWRAREKFLLARLAEAAPRTSDLRILDVGCGDALFFDELDRFGYVEGLEPDEDILTNGPWRSRIQVGTLDRDYAQSHRYDWIVMFDVLEHVEDAADVLAAAHVALEPEGRLFLTVPALQALWTHHDELNHHFIRYTKSSLGSAARAAGFRPLRMQYFFHWLAPLKLLVRLKESLLQGQGQPESVPIAPLNRLAYGISRFEQQIPFASRLPFGTSLFACFAAD